MEKIDTDIKTLLDIIPEALTAGDELTPKALIQAINALPLPNKLLTDLELPHEPFDALDVDAPSCIKLQYPSKILTKEDRFTIVNLLRWTFRELSTWTPQTDPDGKTLSAIFLIFIKLRLRADHWKLISCERAENALVTARLVQLLNNATITMSAGPGLRHDHEQNILDQITEADVKKKWVELAENWRTVSDFLNTPLLFSQGVLYLAYNCPIKLRAVIDQSSQMGVAWLIVKTLPLCLRLNFSKSSSSERFQLATMLSINSSELINRQLTAAASEELAELLHRVAQNQIQWQAWMRIFNQYPSR
jgi:hypothetical protein